MLGQVGAQAAPPFWKGALLLLSRRRWQFLVGAEEGAGRQRRQGGLCGPRGSSGSRRSAAAAAAGGGGGIYNSRALGRLCGPEAAARPGQRRTGRGAGRVQPLTPCRSCPI